MVETCAGLPLLAGNVADSFHAAGLRPTPRIPTWLPLLRRGDTPIPSCYSTVITTVCPAGQRRGATPPCGLRSMRGCLAGSLAPRFLQRRSGLKPFSRDGGRVFAFVENIGNRTRTSSLSGRRSTIEQCSMLPFCEMCASGWSGAFWASECNTPLVPSVAADVRRSSRLGPPGGCLHH